MRSYLFLFQRRKLFFLNLGGRKKFLENRKLTKTYLKGFYSFNKYLPSIFHAVLILNHKELSL